MAQIIQLSGDKNRWRFSTLGGRMLTWEALDGAEWRKIVRGDAEAKPSEDGHRSAVMFPWANRIGGTEWSCEGTRVKIDATRQRGNLHGLCVDAEFALARNDEAQATFRHRVEAGEFYPRSAECAVTYRIVQDGGVEALEVVIVSKNLSEEDGIAYVTTGIHPYFLNPFGAKVDEMTLTCAAAKEIAVDDKLIPTGVIDVTPEHDFRRARSIGDTLFDNGFILQDGASPAAALRDRNFQLTIAPVENCGFMQIYIPAHREEIAIEPQSGGADAFRFHQYGLCRLKSGESFTYRIRLAAQFA